MISLVGMNTDTPDIGGWDDSGGYDADQEMYWGDTWIAVDGLVLNNMYPLILNESMIETPEFKAVSLVHIPSDSFCDKNYIMESLSCPGTFYFASSPQNNFISSPYLYEDGIYKANPAYYRGDGNLSVMSDFKGKQNTANICSGITVNNWETIPTIPDTSAPGNYPAAACCWRYHTPGTNQGDWWLPSAGELGYIMSFYNKINNTLNYIKYFYGSANPLSAPNQYWSSIMYKIFYSPDVIALRLVTGYFSGTAGNNTSVRAFCIVD